MEGARGLFAKNIEFRSNDIRGAKFEVMATDQNHSYSVYWTLNVKVVDAEKKPVKNAEIIIRDNNNAVVVQSQN
jgi:hypothetical protein